MNRKKHLKRMIPALQQMALSPGLPAVNRMLPMSNLVPLPWLTKPIKPWIPPEHTEKRWQHIGWRHQHGYRHPNGEKEYGAGCWNSRPRKTRPPRSKQLLTAIRRKLIRALNPPSNPLRSRMIHPALRPNLLPRRKLTVRTPTNTRWSKSSIAIWKRRQRFFPKR